KTAKVLRSWVVVEHGATFSVSPGVDSIRPRQQTQVDGLLLAGDWTHTGWPATMEGAVRSGYLAAEIILRMLDRPTRLVKAELKPGVLARWLLGPREGGSPNQSAFTPVLRPAEAASVDSPAASPTRFDPIERAPALARGTSAPSAPDTP